MTQQANPAAFSFIIRHMPKKIPPDFISFIAPEAVEVRENHLVFPVCLLLPLSARGETVPGIADCPWSRFSSDLFYTNLPLFYSITLWREPPDTLRGSLRARRTSPLELLIGVGRWQPLKRPTPAVKSIARSQPVSDITTFVSPRLYKSCLPF